MDRILAAVIYCREAALDIGAYDSAQKLSETIFEIRQDIKKLMENKIIKEI